jgi:hypothetical protein
MIVCKKSLGLRSQVTLFKQMQTQHLRMNLAMYEGANETNKALLQFI